MQATIADDLSRTDLTDSIARSIQAAIKFYENDPFEFNQTEAELNTIVGDDAYSLPTDYFKYQHLNIKLGSEKPDPMHWRSYPWIANRRQPTIQRSRPCYFTIYRNEFRIYPAPDQVYTLTLAYLYRLPALSADSDTNAWMTTAEELIRCAAAKRVCAGPMRSPESARGWEMQELAALGKLQAAAMSAQSIGTIQPSEI